MPDGLKPLKPCPGATLYLGDCREVLPALPAGSFDLVFTDPPYPCIKRSYGTWSEAEWWELMRAVVPECMRVLKPTGSAVFVLQPNSERVGRMRTWLWDFMAWVGREWGIVQDAWWCNEVVLANGGVNCHGLMRAAVKACVWVGPPDCCRRQEAVLLPPSARMLREKGDTPYRLSTRGRNMPSGQRVVAARVRDTVRRRGGTTPFNFLRATKGGPEHKAGGGHPAGIPLRVCSFWVRYLCPPGGATLDPFAGTSTVGLAALSHGCDYVGIEAVPEYHQTAARRLAEAAGPLFATPEAACPTT